MTDLTPETVDWLVDRLEGNMLVCSPAMNVCRNSATCELAAHTLRALSARVSQIEVIALAAEELAETVARVTERKVNPATGGRLTIEAEILAMERALATYRQAGEES